MFETVPIERVTSPYGEKRFDDLDKDHVKELEEYFGNSDNWPDGICIIRAILVTKDYKIIDGHHRYAALKNIGKSEVLVGKLDCWFEDTEILRDFQKHLKGMVPEDFDPKTLKDEFEEILSWLLSNVTK